MKNIEVIDTIKRINNNDGIFKRKLPVRVLFALKKNITKLDNAVKEYNSTLSTLFEQYGFNMLNVGDSDLPSELMEKTRQLLEEDIEVEISRVPESLVLESEDNMTFSELDALSFMLTEETEGEVTLDL